MRKTITLLLLTLALAGVSAQPSKAQQPRSWKTMVYGMPGEWYGTAEAVQTADTLLRYQTDLGGWPKNVKWNREIDREEMQRIKETGIGATIDNGATIMEMHYLAKVYAATKEQRFRDGFLRGFGYILAAQYANGGWPQFYPVRPQKSVAYSGHITYNDNAFVNVMDVLRAIRYNAPMFAPLELEDSIRRRAGQAFDRGIDCILKTQIVVDGVPTVWCAQHDAVTLQPAKARAYELPSFSGSESAGVLRLLMELSEPSDSVIAAVKGAVKWFEDHRIDNYRFVHARDKSGTENSRLVPADGFVVWARFYDLETGEPFFCDRDGIKRKTLDEVGLERRNGYGWYTDVPAKILRNYPDWLDRNGLKD